MIDILKTEIDVIHKKLLFFLGAVAGSWFYGLEFAKNENMIMSIILFTIFTLTAWGNLVNISKLSKIEKELKNLKQEIQNAL